MAQCTGSRRRDLHQKNLLPFWTMPHQLKLRSPVTCCWHCSTNPTGIKRISQRPQGLCSGSSGSRIPMEVSLPLRCKNSLPLPSQSEELGHWYKVPVGLWLLSLISLLCLLSHTEPNPFSWRNQNTLFFLFFLTMEWLKLYKSNLTSNKYSYLCQGWA